MNAQTQTSLNQHYEDPQEEAIKVRQRFQNKNQKYSQVTPTG